MFKQTERERPILDAGLTRQEFLHLTGKGLAGLAVTPVLLNLLGCTQEEIDTGAVQVIPTPKGVLVAKRARCTGCSFCEVACTTFNEGSVGSFFSRVKIARHFFYGDKGIGSGGGLYGDLNYTPDTCRQCQKPECMAVCPVKAISFNEEHGCIAVDRKRCIGCSACTTACPWAMATVNPQVEKSGKCILCGECAAACPSGALAVVEWQNITV